MSKLKYDVPILGPKHAEFCKREAARRYGGKIIRDEYYTLLVEDEHGLLHTDAVLRALSLYEREKTNPDSAAANEPLGDEPDSATMVSTLDHDLEHDDQIDNEIAAAFEIGDAIVEQVVDADDHPGGVAYHVWVELTRYLAVCGWTPTELAADATQHATEASVESHG